MKPRHLLLLLLIPLLFILGCGSNDMDETLQLRFAELVRRECIVSNEISDYKATIKTLDLRSDLIVFDQFTTLLNASLKEMEQIHEEKQKILDYFHQNKEISEEKSGFSFTAKFPKVCVSLKL
jgi:uncharacterized protein (UPF0335 family)